MNGLCLHSIRLDVVIDLETDSNFMYYVFLFVLRLHLISSQIYGSTVRQI